MIGYTKEQLDSMSEEELKKVSLILRGRLRRIKTILKYQGEIEKLKIDLGENHPKSKWNWR